MRKILCFFLMLILSSCISKQAVISRDGYASVEIGMPETELIKQFGKPHRIHVETSDEEIYEYVETISVVREVIEQKRYYFVISDRKVIGKYFKIRNTPGYREIYSDTPYPNYD